MAPACASCETGFAPGRVHRLFLSGPAAAPQCIARKYNMLRCSIKRDPCTQAPHPRDWTLTPVGSTAITPDMAESFSSQALPPAKAERYEALRLEIESVLRDEVNQVAKMATVAAMLAAAFDLFLWTGFYVVDPERTDQLVVGPYQGTLGCLRIRFDQGVCGSAASARKTVVVADVDTFPGHIACDSRSRSEIVVPVLDARGGLIGVLDVDSAQPDAFDAVDQAGLEAIVREVFAGCGSP
jgi:GAF domain-containing protein